MKNDSLKEQYRINERIRVREVRLVGDNVEQGVYPTSQALKMAEDQGLDLVEISPNTVDFQPKLDEFEAKITPKTKAVIVTSDDYLVLSALQPETIARRFAEIYENEDKGETHE